MGYCHFPLEDGKGYDEKYFKGLTSEKKVLCYKMGKPFFVWELRDKGQHKRNEALDCRNYATAAIEITNLPLKKQEENKQQAAETGCGGLCQEIYKKLWKIIEIYDII